MALKGHRTPELLSVTATTTATSIYNLLVTANTRADIHRRCCFLQIQLDNAAAGNLYIGNSDMTTTNYGANLVATQGNQQFAFDSNLISLMDIYLLASAATQQVNLFFITR